MKIIPLKNRNIEVYFCGHCPFLLFDNSIDANHRCGAGNELFIDGLYDIYKRCPLINIDPEITEEKELSKEVVIGCD